MISNRLVISGKLTQGVILALHQVGYPIIRSIQLGLVQKLIVLEVCCGKKKHPEGGKQPVSTRQCNFRYLLGLLTQF